MREDQGRQSIQLRLSADGCRLELFLPTDALLCSTEALLHQIQQECLRGGLQVPLNREYLAARLRACRYGTWIALIERIPPRQPVDEQVELLVPVAVSCQQSQSTYQAVHANAPIARIRPAQPGIPGFDPRTGVLPPRPPRRARLPQGENTRVSDDGMQLLATCDGEVVLRHLALHVLPSCVHEGDLLASDGPLTAATGILVRGSVRAGAVVEATGDIHIAGDVETARVTSRRGNITVAGSVAGTATQPCQLQAHGDVSCRSMLHAQVAAGQDLHLRATAKRCTLQVGGNVYLAESLETSMREVTLAVTGGVLPRLQPLPELVPMPPSAERQHVRIATQLRAQMALHGVPPLAFRPCVLEDLSEGGARCRLLETAPDLVPAPGAVIQLKFALPGHGEHLLAIGRVVRSAGPLAAGVAFLQMREHDQGRVGEFCRQTLRQRQHVRQGTRADRVPPPAGSR